MGIHTKLREAIDEIAMKATKDCNLQQLIYDVMRPLLEQYDLQISEAWESKKRLREEMQKDLDEKDRLNGELAEALKAFIAADNGGFDTRHAAENSYCPDCANDSDSWRDQTEHHEGCQYLKRMEAAKAAIEKTAPLKRICEGCGDPEKFPGNTGFCNDCAKKKFL